MRISDWSSDVCSSDLTEIMRTRDFRCFELIPMSGAAARDKGMALFPRKVGGGYAMIGRQDGENLYIIRSDKLTCWDEGKLLLKDRQSVVYGRSVSVRVDRGGRRIIIKKKILTTGISAQHQR